MGVQTGAATVEISVAVPQKTSNSSIMWSSYTTPGYILKGLYFLLRDTCSPTFSAALFTIAGICKQPRHPSADEGLMKMWYPYKMEFYAATKKTDIMKFLSKWMELGNITLSEVTRTQKGKHSMFSRSHSYVDPCIKSLDLLAQLSDLIREINLCKCLHRNLQLVKEWRVSMLRHQRDVHITPFLL